MIFPRLAGKRFGYVNLDLEAERWLAERKLARDPNPLLDPAICQAMVADIHAKYSLDFSYGGWMEDRSTLWKGSYLAQHGTFTHLGIDVNAPSGTEIAASFDAEVARIDDDYPEDGGWGPRVILKRLSKPIYLIHAHLDRNILCKVGDTLKQGQVFASIGKAPYNGNWFPHLHLQILSKEYYDELEKNGSWKELDGYGSADEIVENAARFSDPLEYVSLMAL